MAHSVVQSVDWQALGRATSTISRPARIKLTTLMFNLNQTNYLNNKYYGTTSMCPCCNKETETFHHVLTCSSTLSTSARLVSQENFRSEMEAMSTPPQLIQLVLSFLSEATDPRPTMTDPLLDLHQSQLEIGCDQFLCGRISRK